MTPATTYSPNPSLRPASPIRWLVALLSASVLLTGAQAVCISLAKSTACPMYASYSVDNRLPTTVKDYMINMAAFTTVEEFDRAVFNATGFLSPTAAECPGYSGSVRIPYQNSVLCTIAALDDRAKTCKQTTTSGSLCASSCTLYQQGYSAMVNSRCPKSAGALKQLATITAVCNRTSKSWVGLQDTSATCVDAAKNEAATCGLASLAAKCDYCKTNSTATCCGDATTSCNYTTTTTIAAAPTSTFNPSATPSAGAGAGDSNATSGNGLSVGAMGGIIGGCVGAIILLSFVLCMCWRRGHRHEAPNNKKTLARQISNSSGHYNISNPKLQEEGFAAASTIPMKTLPPVKPDPVPMMAPVASAGAKTSVGALAFNPTGPNTMEKQAYCRVMYPYQASMADELDLAPNDIVNVQRVFDDDWAVGINLNTNNEGAFPIVCVMFVDESALEDDFEEVNMHSMSPMTLREEDELGRRSPSGRNSPRSSLPSRSSSPVHLPRRNSSIRDSLVIVPGSMPATSSPLANNGGPPGPGRLTPPVARDTVLSDASSANNWWQGER